MRHLSIQCLFEFSDLSISVFAYKIQYLDHSNVICYIECKRCFIETLEETVGKRATVYDVANEAGVSTATVSRALNNPQTVRPRTRRIVEEAVRHLNYIPSGSAQGLASQKTGTIGLLMPDLAEVRNLSSIHSAKADLPGQSTRIIVDPPHPDQTESDDPYYNRVIRGCELEAWSSGFSLMISLMSDKAGHHYLDTARSIASKSDGVVVLATSVPDEVITELSKITSVVLVAATQGSTNAPVPVVSTDNYAGMRLLTKHIIEKHGISRMAYIAGPDDSPDNHARYIGFCEALKDEHIIPDSVPIYRCGFDRTRALHVTSQLIKNKTLPQAMICANDQMALGVLEALQENGLHVPDDVIVTGFDGIEETNSSHPRLATIHQPMIDLGRQAIRTLVAMINKSEQGTETKISSQILPVTVLLRESCEGRHDSSHTAQDSPDQALRARSGTNH